MEKSKIVVIGNGMVGYKFCEKAVASSLRSQLEIVVFGEEPRPAYDRVHLSSYFGEKTLEELTMAPLSWYDENDIKIHLGDPVLELDKENKICGVKAVIESFDIMLVAANIS